MQKIKIIIVLSIFNFFVLGCQNTQNTFNIDNLLSLNTKETKKESNFKFVYEPPKYSKFTKNNAQINIKKA